MITLEYHCEKCNIVYDHQYLEMSKEGNETHSIKRGLCIHCNNERNKVHEEHQEKKSWWR